MAQVEHHKVSASDYLWSCATYIILPQTDDEQGHNKAHHQLKNRHHWLRGPIVKGVYQQPSTILQNSTPKRAELNRESISRGETYHVTLAELPQDIKPVRSFSGNRAKMLLKSYLGIKCHSQYFKVNRAFSTVPPIVNKSNWGCNVHDLGTIIVLVVLTFKFIPQRSHHPLTLLRSHIRDSCNPKAWSQLICQNGKKLQGVQEEQ